MCDHYLVERHSYAIAQKAYTETKRPARSNCRRSLQTFTQGLYAPLRGEKEVFQQTGVSLSIAVPKSLQVNGQPQYKTDIDNGTIFLTNQRVSLSWPS
jgi:hypothetical protein